MKSPFKVRKCNIGINSHAIKLVEHSERMTSKNHPRWKNYTEEDREDIKSYKAGVTQITNTNYRKYYYIINPYKLKRSRNKFHLDHIYSIIDGFNNKVPPEIIANPYNLKVITYIENISKKGNSHMTLSQLYIFYICFLLKQKMEGT